MALWRLIFTHGAEQDLDELDKFVRNKIIEKLDWFVVNFDEAKHLGLRENLTGYFKLRVGDWRVIYKFENTNHIITIILIRHRSRVYDI